ncbi:hypothetical protein GGR56DRAFT_671629 [Xylariaceae sp. FL0804]|nr:hypothetical protein GGR56DRAFT_671629 [Xylariaceae sp. FL0804]
MSSSSCAGKFCEDNGIAVAELIYYLPTGGIAIYLASKHGFRRANGWIFLILMSVIRCVGAGINLAEIHWPDNSTLATTSGTLQSIGLSPLILAALGLIHRARNNIEKVSVPAVNSITLRILQIAVTVGLFLSVSGATKAGSDLANGKTSTYEVQDSSKWGSILTIIAFVLLVFAALMVASQSQHIEHGERRLVWAVFCALPFILVRLAYSGLTVFENNSDFSVQSPDYTVEIAMGVVPEMIVVLIFEGFGLTLHKFRKSEPLAPATGPALEAAGGRRPYQTQGYAAQQGPGYGGPGYGNQGYGNQGYAY